MSYINPNITSIIANGITNISPSEYSWTSPVELECYEWLRIAYPDIFAEFKAVHDVSK